MLDSLSHRFTGWMKRVTKANQSIYIFIGRNHTRYPTSHGLAANDKFLVPFLEAGPQLLDHRLPGFQQHGRTIWRSTFTCLATALHIGEFEPSDAQATFCKTVGNMVHERRVHAGTSTMGQSNQDLSTR